MSRQLELRLRQHRGKGKLNMMLSELSEALHRPPDSFQRVNLETTDRMLALWSHLAKNDVLVRVETADEEQVLVTMNPLRAIGKQDMLLYRGLSTLCGAVIVDLQELLVHCFDLISSDQEDIIALTPDLLAGVFLRSESISRAGRQETIYTCAVYGAAWQRYFPVH